MPTWLLFFVPFLFGKRSSSSSSKAAAFDEDSAFARFVAGDVVGTLYTRPQPVWRVMRGSKVLAQGTDDGEGTGALARPMLEAFTAATPGQPVTIYVLTLWEPSPRWLTISVFPVNGPNNPAWWGWSITDGTNTYAGAAQPKRGQAIIAAMNASEGENADGSEVLGG